jgi:ABC-type polysaccharide/polyol phosphate transport system ATPase subunit
MASTDTAAEGRSAAGSGRPQRPSAAPIVVEGVRKRFKIPLDAPSTLKERALHPFRRVAVRDLPALDDLSFEVKAGEFFGIVGSNGSGKSTLLKLLAGIYQPDTGRIEVKGRVSPFIELGVGFNKELAARDNVVINCALLGLGRAEALRRFEQIIEFAELEDFVDLKLKNYSSGMQVRLAFATAIQVDADVILLDEVLAVGDAGFQQKCFEVFRRLRGEGRTVILVTHSLETVERFCDRVMMLENGGLAALGEPERVLSLYRERAGAAIDPGAPPRGEDRFGDGSAEIVAAWFEDAQGRRIEACEQGERLTFVAEAVFVKAMPEPALGFQLHDENDTVVFVTSTFWLHKQRPSFDAGDRVRMRISFENVLGVGRHFAAPAVADRDSTMLADYRIGMASILVTGKRWTAGVVDLPHAVEVEKL